MEEKLMSPNNKKWVISTVLAIVAIIVPYGIYFLSLENKNMDFEIISHSGLVGEKNIIKGLEIKINDEAIKTLTFHSFIIRNSGSLPILSKDFEKPIKIYFKDNSTIYSSEVKRKQPSNLSVISRESENCLLIEPLLLNHNDEFVIDLYSSSTEYPAIDARIAGIPAIDCKFPKSNKMSFILFTWVSVFFLIFLYAKLVTYTCLRIKYFSINILIIIENFVIGLICIFSAGMLMKFVLEIKSFSSICVISFPACILGALWCGYRMKRRIKSSNDATDSLEEQTENVVENVFKGYPFSVTIHTFDT